MQYRAVGNRCAVDMSELRLPISDEAAFEILLKLGFKRLYMNPVRLAEGCIGVSEYRRNAKPSEAPNVVDCSSFVKWVYGQCGIWLPRRTIQQREFGSVVVMGDLAPGDVIFVSGLINYYENDPAQGVGHVGIYSEQNMIIHAANKKLGVVKETTEEFWKKHSERGIRRYIPHYNRVVMFETPPDREVEISDDLRWIVLQTLSD